MITVDLGGNGQAKSRLKAGCSHDWLPHNAVRPIDNRPDPEVTPTNLPHKIAPADGLLPGDVVPFAPGDRDLSQRVRAEFKPVRFDAVNSQGVLEIPECSGAVNRVQ